MKKTGGCGRYFNPCAAAGPSSAAWALQTPRARPAAPAAVGRHLLVAGPRCTRPARPLPAAPGAAAAPSELRKRPGVSEQSSKSARKLSAVQFCLREKGQACTCP